MCVLNNILTCINILEILKVFLNAEKKFFEKCRYGFSGFTRGGFRLSCLVGIQPVLDIVALTLQTSFIENEKNGTSLLLVAKPEAAKTSTIFEFRSLDFVSYYDEVTQKKLMDEFLPQVKQGDVKTLLVPDLINCIEKQKSTRDQFLSIIKTGIDDAGIIRISTYHKQLYYMGLSEGLRFNMVTAITTDNFRKIRKYLDSTGLLSRFVPFTYDYPIDKLQEIFRIIEGNRKQKAVILPSIKKKMVVVPHNPHLFRELELVSSRIGSEYSGYGIRSQISLQRLAKASAVLDGRTTVKKKDIERIIHLSKWMNFAFNPL